MDIRTVNQILREAKKTSGKIYRIKYQPYNFNYAKNIWFHIAAEDIGDVEMTEGLKKIWSNLIKYVHADESCEYDLNKTICLMGRTGSGKTQTILTLQKYISVDNVQFVRRAKIIPFNFKIISARLIFDEYCETGMDALAKYNTYSNICIDDLGAEPKEGIYFGTRLNVICEVIERRYERGLTTHFTTNLDEKGIREYYDDRVYSRIKEQCNIIVLNDKDFRING